MVPSSDSELAKTDRPLQAAPVNTAGKKDTSERGYTPLEEDREEELEEEEDEVEEVGAQPVTGGSHGNGENSEKRKASSSLQSGKEKKKPKKVSISFHTAGGGSWADKGLYGISLRSVPVGCRKKRLTISLKTSPESFSTSFLLGVLLC